jgi:phosphoenolpyruvate carboxylase
MIRSLTQSWMIGDSDLRRDLRLLGWMLRNEMLRDGHDGIWKDLVRLRELAVRHEAGDASADAELSELFHNASVEHLDLLLRVLGLFFDLANISEDLQRERVIRTRRAQGRLDDGLPARLKRLRPDQRTRLDNLQADFVLTAHPTEAKRQTVRRVLDRMRRTLRRLTLAPRGHRRDLLSSLREDLRALVRTDPLHPHRPEVLEELDRALYVSDAMWSAVPTLVGPIDRARRAPTHPIRFGCWIGGDRDGHPHVTVDITHESLLRLRRRAIRFHLRECEALADELTMICRNPAAMERLNQVSAAAPGSLERLHPREHYRRALESMRQRLEAGLNSAHYGYRSGEELEQDIAVLADSLRRDGLRGRALHRVEQWRRRARVFGLHLMRLDLRENSRGYRTLLRELLPLLGEDASRVDRDDFDGLWDRDFDLPDPAVLESTLSERSHDLLRVTHLLQSWADTVSPEGVGVNVISMTHCTADALWVLWMQRLVAHSRKGTTLIPIAPLFETIDDLQRAAGMLRELFRHPAWRAALAQQGDRQVVMVGYSDSAKDGGYLAACWALYEGQEQMQRIAAEEGIALTCFHGRGGALGRGGGPAARAIQALPPSDGDAHIRMTEQGEVIADRFADPALAHRHMEQILGGLLLHASEAAPAPAEWRDCMRDFAARGREVYLALFQDPAFPDYFRQATPIECIETLPIGSRPSRRHGAGSIEDLRAIPYTFSWTQSRQLINAFYGLGSAWEKLSRRQRHTCLVLYREWPFFRSMIDNAELALTKCDPAIARLYAGLVTDSAVGKRLGGAIVAEMERTRSAILAMTDRPSLMADSAWLRRSVEIRKPFIDVLNHIQIELLRRQRALPEPDEALQRSLRLSVQGIAAGLRTTG